MNGSSQMPINPIRKYVICNADEEIPALSWDRSVLEATLHSVLEGMIIAAYAIEATAVSYMQGRYPLPSRGSISPSGTGP